MRCPHCDEELGLGDYGRLMIAHMDDCPSEIGQKARKSFDSFRAGKEESTTILLAEVTIRTLVKSLGIKEIKIVNETVTEIIY